jgi:hypothetical protein
MRFKINYWGIVITFLLLIVGLGLIIANFTCPHTEVVQKTSQVAHQNDTQIATFGHTILSGNLYYPPMQNTSVYQEFPIVNLTKGEGIEVRWASDIWLIGFIFTPEQFSNFKSTIPTIQEKGKDDSDWAKINGINYQAIGDGTRHGIVSFNASQSGTYVAVITNVNYGSEGAYCYVSSEEYVITYYYETIQVSEAIADYLYLYIGIALLLIMIVMVLISAMLVNLIKK